YSWRVHSTPATLRPRTAAVDIAAETLALTPEQSAGRELGGGTGADRHLPEDGQFDGLFDLDGDDAVAQPEVLAASAAHQVRPVHPGVGGCFGGGVAGQEGERSRGEGGCVGR